MKTTALPALRVTVRALLPALLTMIAAFPFSLVAGTESGRIWSNADGRTLHAEFVSQQDGIVRLRRIEDGREYPVAIDHLSIQDRQYLEQDGPHIDRIRATNKPTRPDFVYLRDYAMAGNTYAVDALNELAEKLYEGLNPERDREKWLSNLTLMRSVFTPWGLAAGAGNHRAFDTLVLAASYSRIRSFVPDALGQGAAKGCERCMDVLLQHQSHKFPTSSVVSAMAHPAANMNARAIRFLADILENELQKPLWYMVSNALRIPADNGDITAAQALAHYERNAQ